MKKRQLALYKVKNGKEGLSCQDRLLRLLYGTRAGRFVLSFLVKPWVSNACGRLLDSSISRIAVNMFVKRHNIDMSQCEKNKFDSYNDFFKRKLVSGARPVCDAPACFVSPCDSRLTVYDIGDTDRCTFNIKDSEYTLEELLRDKKLAERYRGGKLWLFRLQTDDYHRYIYNVDGVQSPVRRIEGVYHTVNPIANHYYHIYKENSREYCLIKTPDAGTIVAMEVGALLVGRIENACTHKCTVKRGQEKGNFAFGGSTVILLTQKDMAVPIWNIECNSRNNIETRVLQGQIVGTMGGGTMGTGSLAH